VTHYCLESLSNLIHTFCQEELANQVIMQLELFSDDEGTHTMDILDHLTSHPNAQIRETAMELMSVFFDDDSRDDLVFEFDDEKNLAELGHHIYSETEGQAPAPPSAFQLVAGGAAQLEGAHVAGEAGCSVREMKNEVFGPGEVGGAT